MAKARNAGTGFWRLGELKAWVMWRDERAVAACSTSRDELPMTLVMYPASYMPDLPREVPFDRPDGLPQPVPRTTEEQRCPTIDEALRSGTLTAFRLFDGGPKEVSPAQWEVQPVDENREPLLFTVSQVKRVWPSEPSLRRGRPPEYDWPRILEIAAEERLRAPSGRKLEQWVQARCEKELGCKPSVEAIRHHLKSAQ